MPTQDEIDAVLQLAGCFVVEVGERQAWPFVTFCDNRPTESVEVRLYIDTDYRVIPAPDLPAGLDESQRALLSLNSINMLGVERVTVSPDADLIVRFEDGVELHVSGIPNDTTTSDVWSLGNS